MTDEHKLVEVAAKFYCTVYYSVVFGEILDCSPQSYYYRMISVLGNCLVHSTVVPHVHSENKVR